VIRIIGGSARGRSLQGPEGLEFRPTTGRVKETIFSILGDGVAGVRMLDLFSGSGSLGIEALSRGAGEVSFVEHSEAGVALLEKNLAFCGFTERGRIIRGDVFHIIPRLHQEGRRFDLIIADPPFQMKLHQKIVTCLQRFPLLAPGPSGRLIIEHEVRDTVFSMSGLRQTRQKKFGHCMVSWYEAVG
jgi:16S rRNA (guanine(966)-N(2))-methyltransferase RsmD